MNLHKLQLYFIQTSQNILKILYQKNRTLSMKQINSLNKHVSTYNSTYLLSGLF